ncbi:MAG: YhgE/Pip domain-containing protein, partial [Pseudobutyrivibrio sp.]|nr:YhgE/Pip domain-containing protein [Pseudobutyrivibrio sp.]
MKNILKIIASDIKRLSINVVAIVVIIGLSVIPCLYAWFNILSNWDPYGPDATGNLQVAVASSDKGLVIGNYELNVGDIIINNLKENDSIGWVFTDTADEAVDGVHSGDYYAALVIDEQFTANMISFLGGNIENPMITYYENEKKNAIAPKITGKVKTTIQNEVNKAFISTITETFLSVSDNIVSMDEESNLSTKAIGKLENLDSDIKAVVLILDSYIALMDSTENLMTAGEAVSDSVDSILTTAETMTEAADASIQSSKGTVTTVEKLISSQLDAADKRLTEIDKNISSKLNGQQGNLKGLTVQAENLSKIEGEARNLWNDAAEATNIYDDSNPEQADNAKEVDKAFDEVEADLENLKKKSAETDADATRILNRISANIQTIRTGMNGVRAEYNNSVRPQIDVTLKSAEASIAEVKQLLNYNATSIDLVSKSLNSYPDMMKQSRASLVKSRDEAIEMQTQLEKLIGDLKGLEQNDQYQAFIELVKNDPNYLADFVSSPVKVSEEYVYPVENNGSMTAPFYIVLSIWVGSLIMSTILKTEIKDMTGFENATTLECFLGRFFVTYIIGQIQTIITVLGALFFVGIQCEHPLMLILACSWTSFVYALLLYSFTYSFGNIGEALAVVLMVIQVAGAGGTFPIEVLPKVFQVLYKFMPFNYSMNAVRECIGGTYKNTYWIYLGVLC